MSIAAFVATMKLTRHMTLKLVADLSDDQMVFQPAPNMNHPAWVFGQLILVDYAFLTLVTGQPAPDWINDEYRAVYGGKSQPVSDKSKYKGKQWYLDELSKVRALMLARMETITPEELNAPHPDPARRERFPTVAHALFMYGTWHEAYHAGQLSAWRRVQGLPAV